MLNLTLTLATNYVDIIIKKAWLLKYEEYLLLKV